LRQRHRDTEAFDAPPRSGGLACERSGNE